MQLVVTDIWVFLFYLPSSSKPSFALEYGVFSHLQIIWILGFGECVGGLCEAEHFIWLKVINIKKMELSSLKGEW